MKKLGNYKQTVCPKCGEKYIICSSCKKHVCKIVDIKEQFISQKTLQLAIEKNLDFSNIEIRDSKTLLCVNNVKERLDYFGNMKAANLIQIPTQSLLQKQLRDIYNLCVLIYKVDIDEYTFHVWGVSNRQIDHQATYEEALEKGLFEALKMIEINDTSN
jgi:hypothetical protein